MSTRAQIWVESSDVVIYRHSDGYPEGPNGVLAGLLPLLRNFKKFRGWDPFYLSAHITHAFVEANRQFWIRCAKRDLARTKKGTFWKPYDPEDYEDSKYIGHGVEAFTGVLHGDVEFFYVVRPAYVEVRIPGSGGVPGAADDRAESTKIYRCFDLDGNPYRMTAGRKSRDGVVSFPNAPSVVSRPVKTPAPKRQIDL